MWELLFYWIGLGMVVNYSLFHPERLSPDGDTNSLLFPPLDNSRLLILNDYDVFQGVPLIPAFLAMAFVFSQYMNFKCHKLFSFKQNKLENDMEDINDSHENIDFQ